MIEITGESFAQQLENASPGDVFRLSTGTHHATRSVTITTDNITLIIPNGAVLIAPSGIEEAEKFIRVEADGVSISGGGIIDGNQDQSNGLQSNPPESHGHEHIIQVGHHSIPWVSGFRMDGLTLRNSAGGDGLYFIRAEDCEISRFTIDTAYRNGITMTDIRNTTIRDFTIKNAEGVSPQAGIAVEPNSEGDVIDGVTITSGMCRNNALHGLYVNNHFTDQQQGSSEIDIEVENMTAKDNGWHGFSLHGTSGAENIHLDQCTSLQNGRSGFFVGGDGNVQIENSSALDNGQNRDNNNLEVGIALDEDMGNATVPNLLVTGMEFDSPGGTQKHPGVALDGSTLRVSDCRVGSHGYSKDGFRAHQHDSTVKYDTVTIESGDPIAFATDGGSVSGFRR